MIRNTFEHILREHITEGLDTLFQALGNNQAIKTIEDYRFIVGKTEGLKACLQYCEMAREDMEK